MPEAGAERVPSPEFQKASQGLMLHIANGDFDTSHAAQLNKAPTNIAKRSFDALDAQHRKAQEDEQQLYDAVHKKTLEELGWPPEKITSEQLRHMHMRVWAMKESGRIQGIFKGVASRFQGDEEQKQRAHMQVVSALNKLHIVIDNGTDLENFADQLYKTTSNTTGVESEFYKTFCSGDSNAKLLNALAEADMIAIKPFLVDMLGSTDAFDALLATKQTQDVLNAKKDFSQTAPTIKSNEQHILTYFKQGEQLLGLVQPRTPRTIAEPTVEPETLQSAKIGVSESQGRRAEMEDAHVVERNLGGKTDRNFYAIYDGHGGRQIADKAAERLHQNLVRQLNENHLSPTEALKAAYADTDRSMQNEQTPGGATALTVLIDGNKLYVANLGDARAIIIHGKDEAERLSRDRKANDPNEQQEILARGGTIVQDRVVGTSDAQGRTSLLAVSAALGDYDYKGLQKVPDIKEMAISPTDKWVVLACDGVWDVIRDDEVASIIDTETDPQKVSTLLLNEALKRGSTDNLSVIVLPVGNKEETQKQEDK